MKAEFGPVSETAAAIAAAAVREAPPVTPPAPKSPVLDIGAAITQPMLDEYRDVSTARKAGKPMPRLDVAYVISIALLLGGIGFALFKMVV